MSLTGLLARPYTFSLPHEQYSGFRQDGSWVHESLPCWRICSRVPVMPVSTDCDSCWWELHDLYVHLLGVVCFGLAHIRFWFLSGFIGYWRPAVWCIWVCVATRWQQWTVNRFLPAGWAIISFLGRRGAKHLSTPENDTAKTSRCSAYHHPKTAEQNRPEWSER